MPSTRDTNFTLVDYTEEINLYPKVWSLISGMDLFDVHNITETKAEIEIVTEVLAEIEARQRGGERNFITSESAVAETLNVPFFPLDRKISAADIQNFRKYGTGEDSKSLVTEIDRVMGRVRSSHAALREKCMALAIQGLGFGTSYVYATKFGQTQISAPVDFSALTIDPRDTLEASARRPIIKNAQDGSDSHAAYSVIALCGETWFDGLLGHPLVADAYSQFESQQDPLRKRLGMNSENDSVRVFRSKGIMYVEDLSGNFAAGEAFILPLNMPEMFRVYFSPIDDAAHANTAGQELYMQYKENSFDRQYKVESETSMLCVNTRNDLVAKSVGTFA